MTSGTQESEPLAELARLFLRLGVTAFGGPAAHIAMMHREVVRERGWIDEQRFLDLIGATNLIPGPNSTEMAMHVGHDRRGWRGLVMAGASFIVPAALIVLAFAWAYVAYGSTPAGEALFYGVKPVIIAIVVQALLSLGRTALKDWFLAVMGLAVAGLWLAGVNELLLLAAGSVVVLAARSTSRAIAGAFLSWPAFSAISQVEGGAVDLGRLFGVFLKVGAVLYGSGYVMLAFLQRDLVDRLGWLTTTQLLDAVAIGQLTPGPVFTTATFVGYLVAGLPGAAVATIGIFLPSFFFVGLLARILPFVRKRQWTGNLLDGVNVSSLGLMGGVSVELGLEALVDPVTIGLATASGLLLWRTRLNAAWLVLGGAAIGLLAKTSGLVVWVG